MPTRLPAAVSDQLVYCQRNISNGYTYMTFQLDGHIDVDRLQRAARLLVDAEPILGCRFVEHWFRPYWARRTDLDELEWVPVFAGTELEEQLALHTDRRRDPCTDPVFRLLLFQGETDAVSLELCNICSDGTGGLYLFRRLGEIYERLASEPQYVPAMGRIHDRGYDVLGRAFRWRDRGIILRNVWENFQRLRSASRWHFPPPDTETAASFLHQATFSAEQVQNLSRYGRRHGATVPILLLAAIYRGLKAEFDPEETRPLPVFMPVSLRSYFPGEFDDIPTHFVGGTVFVGAGPADVPFGETLDGFRAQFKERRKKFLGVMSPALLIETIPPLNWLFHLLPYPFVRWRVQGRTGRMRRGAGPGLTVFTCMELGLHSVKFGSHSIESVSVSGNIPRIAGVATFAVVRLGDTLTLATSGFENCISAERMQRALDRIDHDLRTAIEQESAPVQVSG